MSRKRSRSSSSSSSSSDQSSRSSGSHSSRSSSSASGSKKSNRSRSSSSNSSKSSDSRSKSASSRSSRSESRDSRSVSRDRKHRSRSRSREFRRGERSPLSPRRRARSKSPFNPKSTKIYVGRLTRNVNKEHLNEIFCNYGAIKSVELPADYLHPFLSRGFAYVEYEKADEAEKAIKFMDGGQIDGQTIHVSVAVGPRAKAPPMYGLKPRRGGRGGPYRPRRSPSPRRRRSPSPRRYRRSHS